MQNKAVILGLTLMVAGWWSGCSTAAPGPAAANAGARQHFDDYLNNCGTNEVRCLWFLQDDPRIGMVMTIHLAEKSVYTVRDVYAWAEQAEHTRELDDSEVAQIRHIVSHLPPPDKHSPYNSAVFISIRDGNAARVFKYDRHFTPAVIQQLYGIAGGYFYGDD